jgi:hypothetical protein
MLSTSLTEINLFTGFMAMLVVDLARAIGASTFHGDAPVPGAGIFLHARRSVRFG